MTGHEGLRCQDAVAAGSAAYVGSMVCRTEREGGPEMVMPRISRLLPDGPLLLDPVLNLWGTVTSDWQEQVKALPAVAGIPGGGIYDPKLPSGVPHTRESIKDEVAALGKNGYHLVVYGDSSEAYISNLEGGAVALQVLGGAEAFLRIEPLPERIGESAIRARALVAHVAQHVQQLTNRLRVETNVTSTIANDRALQSWLAAAAGGMAQALPCRVVEPSRDQPLARRIHLSGTAIPAESSRVKAEIISQLEGAPYLDAYTPAADFTSEDIEQEYRYRTESAVSLHVITNDTASMGAIGEVFWLAALAYLNGQRFGLYVEPTDPERLSDYPRSIKLRQALRMHLDRVQQVFPGLIYEAASPTELAEWAKVELAHYAPVVDSQTHVSSY